MTKGDARIMGKKIDDLILQADVPCSQCGGTGGIPSKVYEDYEMLMNQELEALGDFPSKGAMKEKQAWAAKVEEIKWQVLRCVPGIEKVNGELIVPNEFSPCNKCKGNGFVKKKIKLQELIELIKSRLAE